MDFSHLEAEWHPDKNIPIQFTPTLRKGWKYWWLGDCGHEWEASIQTRVQSITEKARGCSVCSSLAEDDLVRSAEWHPTKNGKITPDKIGARSSKKYWWQCALGHEWEARIHEMVSQVSGCRICVGKNTRNRFDDLSLVYPWLAAEWNYVKNAPLMFDSSLKMSSKYWWQCALGHEWEATLKARILDKDRHQCEDSTVKGKETLGYFEDTVTIALTAEWHPTKNAPLIFNMSLELDAKIWWLCSKGHEWQASVRSRGTNAQSCLVCSGHILVIGENDLITTNPEIAAEWHPHRNGELIPQQVTAQSGSSIWWQCAQGHEWTSLISQRTNNESYSKCQKCARDHNSYLAARSTFEDFPILAGELHPTKNSTLYRQITPHFLNSVWWVGYCGHEWTATPYSRVKNDKGCRVCSGYQVLSGVNDIATLDPIRCREWHPIKNGNLTPDKITFTSSEKFWWLCSKGHEWQAGLTKLSVEGTCCSTCSFQRIANTEWHFGKNSLTMKQAEIDPMAKLWWICSARHEWQASLYSRVEAGKGCPICSNKDSLSLEWHPTKNRGFTLSQSILQPKQRVWWQCAVGHEWQASTSSRISNRSGYIIKCHICSSIGKIIAHGADLAATHPEIAAEWHPTKNGDLTPENITAGANNKYWWLGACGHEWEAFLSNKIADKGQCPECRVPVFISKPEQEIYDYVCGLDMAMDVRQSFKISRKELDIYIPEKKFAVEFNGVYWHSERYRNSEYHYKKWETCKRNGITLMQIWEDDWNRNPEQIKYEIANFLGLADRRKISVQETFIKNVDQVEAEAFLNENHVEGSVHGSYYLGLFDVKNPDTLIALLVLGNEIENETKILNIVRYAMSITVMDGFAKLLLYAMETYNPDYFIATADNCGLDGHLYETHGFSEGTPVLPDYKYLIGVKRYPKSDYSMDRFQNDPKLEWAEGFTEEELAYLNDLIRIWDAGKTRYRY